MGLRNIFTYDAREYTIGSVVITLYNLTCNVSVSSPMTAEQLPGNGFELANDYCCYAI